VIVNNTITAVYDDVIIIFKKLKKRHCKNDKIIIFAALKEVKFLGIMAR
jgi:hypothetical protein